MPGVLTHVGVMLAGVLASFLIFRKLRYGIAFSIGQAITDFLALGITGVRYGHVSFYKIMDYQLFYTIGRYLHVYGLWLIIAAIIQLIVLGLYFIKVKDKQLIDKNKLIMLTIMNISFLAGVLLHIYLDTKIFEEIIWV